MKQILHVFRAGITGGICIALLTACQDGGRGTFKSRRYTLVEICEWQKANNKASSCDPAKSEVIDTKGVVKTPVDQSSNQPSIPPIESVIDPVVTPRNEPSIFQRPQPVPKQQEVQQQDTNPGSAHGQTIVETAKAAPATASRDQFLAEVEKRISQKDPEATKLFKGIDINVNYDPAQKSALIEIDAYALVAGGMRFVQVKPTVIKFDPTASKIGALDYEIREELNGPAFPANENLTIAATCAVQTCEDVRVLMEFKIGGGNLVAAFKVLHVGDSKFEIKGTNLVTRETFKQALESLVVKPVANEKAEQKDVAAPVEQKNDEIPQSDVKPVEPKPADVKPTDVKPAEEKPSQAQSVENKPVEFKPVTEQPKPAEVKPAEQSQVKNQAIRNRLAAAKKRALALKSSQGRKSATQNEKPKAPAVRYKDVVEI